jgi:hypothetical protein
MNTKRTNTKADSSTCSRTTRRPHRRVSKRAQFRAKVAIIAGSVVLFFASLVGIATFNPRVGQDSPVPVQAQQITIVKRDGSDAVVLAPPPAVTAVRPLARSRGS